MLMTEATPERAVSASWHWAFAIVLFIVGMGLSAPVAAATDGPGGGCGSTSCDVFVPGPGTPGGGAGGGGGSGGGNGSGGGSGSIGVGNPAPPQTDQQSCAALGGVWVPGGSGFGSSGGYCVIPNGTPNPANPAAAPTVTPEQVAAMARERITLTAPAVGTAPCRDTGCMGAVGVPVWLWVDGGFPSTSATASAGGLSVTVNARMTRVDWYMGDGALVRCTTPGTAFKEVYGFTTSPDCGHMYTLTSDRQQGGKYPVTARATWEVTFTGDYTASTTVPVDSTVQLRIGEYQAVITG